MTPPRTFRSVLHALERGLRDGSITLGREETHVTPPDAFAPFLAAIIARPEDDLPRLIFADYLDERGDPRGEFIRVQCELARAPACDSEPPCEQFNAVLPAYVPQGWCENCCRLDALRRRERELLTVENAVLWSVDLGAACRLATRTDFRRGFIESITLPAADLLAHLDALLAAAPVTLIRLAEGPTVERPAGCGVEAFKAAAGAVAGLAARWQWRETGADFPYFTPGTDCVTFFPGRFAGGRLYVFRVKAGGWEPGAWCDGFTAADIPEECRHWPRVTLAWAGRGGLRSQLADRRAELGL